MKNIQNKEELKAAIVNRYKFVYKFLSSEGIINLGIAITRFEFI